MARPLSLIDLSVSHKNDGACHQNRFEVPKSSKGSAKKTHFCCCDDDDGDGDGDAVVVVAVVVVVVVVAPLDASISAPPPPTLP